ncbi:DM13 domain-containing protein [Marinicellulosiphila megalodicopiae]|uniref:DM13 domain-containing protein n=1 Tax=Marinicellulosiphila megalodicopiae TaxID=2724896 RepID=UPI003BB1F9B5
MFNSSHIFSSVILSLFILQSCQVIETSDDQFSGKHTGSFSKIQIEGLKYQSGDITGITNDMGEFEYEQGKKISFYIADQQLISLDNSNQINYYPTYSTVENDDETLINFWRLMLSLDLDGDASNGIYLDPAIHNLQLSDLDLSTQTSNTTFETNANEWVAANKGYHTQLIPSENAITQITNIINTDFTCGSTHEKVGQTMTFKTKSHDVSGTAEILNDCTIRITNFTFDGKGPAVYFYTGNNGNFNSGSRLSEKLTRAYNNEVVDIPVSNLDDFDSLSVWCVQFRVSFGDGVFN